MVTTVANRSIEVTRPPRTTLATRILIGLGAGVATGLFVGERAAALQVYADAYIRLLQMTVLPYVTLSLIGGLGALDRHAAARLGTRVAVVLLVFWGIALLGVFALPLMFPRIAAASFFSTTLLEEGAAFDLIGLYIPANPFNALANNVVPAVVLFSALLGIALIAVPGKAAALQVVTTLNAAVSRIARWIVALTPLGLFVIATVAAGTLNLGQAMQLQLYLACYLTVCLLLALWVLPGLVAAVTPVPYWALLARSRSALLMAFATGSVFVVLPLLAQHARELLREYGGLSGNDEELPDLIIPAAYSFPNAGKVLALGFVLFAAWFTGAAIPPADYPLLASAGVLALFGSVNVAIPFLLDMFRIPADTFQLFLATGVVSAHFGTLLAAVHALAIGVIGSCSLAGVVRLDVAKLTRFAIVTLVLAAALVTATRVLVERAVSQPYDKDQVLAGMHALRHRGEAQVLAAAAPLPAFAGSLVDRIRGRGMLRVGYFDDSLPFVFTNTAGDLVGFDVEMALQLARDLGVGLELVAVNRRVLDEGIDPASCDLVMSGATITADRATRIRFSTSYLDETVAIIVPDHRRAAFSSWNDIRAMKQIRLGVPGETYYHSRIRAELPSAEVVTFHSPDEMFRPRQPPLDALVLTAERGSAYTLLHPEYSVVVPRPRPVKVPLAYAIAGRDEALAAAVDAWIDLKRKDGTIDELFAHWILGRTAAPDKRRWSVMDDVLRWN